MDQLESPIELNPPGDVTASVIWLHGLGADGHDFESVVPALRIPDDAGIRFVFPHAPKRPVTINGGMVMRAWYDISPVPGGFRDQEADILESASLITRLIDNEVSLGVPPECIVLAGFSQGGAVALYTALNYTKPLAGVMALSTYLPMAGAIREWPQSRQCRVPVFQAHGLLDPLISVQRGREARDQLGAAGFNVEWHQYAMEHSVCNEEIADIAGWLLRVLSTSVD
jgi:phospholipase/carboxylesterase